MDLPNLAPSTLPNITQLALALEEKLGRAHRK